MRQQTVPAASEAAVTTSGRRSKPVGVKPPSVLQARRERVFHLHERSQGFGEVRIGVELETMQHGVRAAARAEAQRR